MSSWIKELSLALGKKASEYVGQKFNDFDSLKADNAYQNALMTKSKESRAVLRRQGRYDVMPSVGVKRVLFVGVPHNNYFYQIHDLFLHGIPFHYATFTQFVANYDTAAWKAKYDIIIIGGTWIAADAQKPWIVADTATPTTVNAAVTDILTNNKYKLIQVANTGMSKSGETGVKWYTALGVTENAPTISGTCTIVNDTGIDVLPSDTAYGTVSGVSISVKGASLVRLAYQQENTDMWFAAAEVTKKWAVIGSAAGTNNQYASVIDLGKVVKYLRGIYSGIRFNKINAKTYYAWGYDCDHTIKTDVIDKIYSLQPNRPFEIGLVSSYLTPTLAEYFKGLQAKGAVIVSHSYTHFTVTLPNYVEWKKSLETLDKFGLEHFGIQYLTLVPRPEVYKPLIDKGELLCGYVSGYQGRGSSYLPIGQLTDMLTVSYLMGGAPIISSSLTDDVLLMTDYGTNTDDAYNRFVTNSNRAEAGNTPISWFMHDLPLDITWNQTTWTNGNIYHNSHADAYDKRLKFYTDVFAYLETKFAGNYLPLRRSEAVELITDINNCVQITSETRIDGSETIKIASSRDINGLTAYVTPIDANKTKSITSITIDGVAISSTTYFRGSSKIVDIPIDVAAGMEHTIVVTYA